MRTLIVTATRQDAFQSCTKVHIPLVQSLLKKENIFFVQPVYGVPDRLDTPLFIKKEFLWIDADLLIVTQNKRGLPYVYNNVLRRELDQDKYDCVIFVHDDVEIQHPKTLEIIKEKFVKEFSVVGLAGAGEIILDPAKPMLWHCISKQETWSGAVAHTCTSGVHVTTFGPTPQRCLVIDGLFLAIKLKDLKTNPVFFDTQFTFHLYDLDFCLSINTAKMRITTVPIWVTHHSPGLRNLQDPLFQSSQGLFLKKWSQKV